MAKIVGHTPLIANPGRAAWQGGGFRPNEYLRFDRSGGLEPNFTRWQSSDPMWAARFFVGFNVAGEPTYSLDHLVQVVRDVRQLQDREPDSSFMYQRGIYAHESGDEVVEEDGAQIIILNTEGLPAETFQEEMVAVAEQIARQMDQEEVILELQRGGVVQQVMGVGP